MALLHPQVRRRAAANASRGLQLLRLTLASDAAQAVWLYALSNGYLAIGENSMAKFSFAGALEWSEPLPVPPGTETISFRVKKIRIGI